MIAFLALMYSAHLKAFRILITENAICDSGNINRGS